MVGRSALLGKALVVVHIARWDEFHETRHFLGNAISSRFDLNVGDCHSLATSHISARVPRLKAIRS